ncbi:MAG: effector binding domain-containing protein [Pseudomonadota bacterium]
MQQQRGGGFTVLGVSARVRNDDPAAIGALWDAFRARDLRAEIGPGASEEVYCVYHDYAGGHADPYRMTIGYRAPAADVPEALHRAEVPEQQVAQYRAEGPQPQTLISQWQEIWQSDRNRAYIADYDVYDAHNPELVTITVGLAEA